MAAEGEYITIHDHFLAHSTHYDPDLATMSSIPSHEHSILSVLTA